jgi:membrane protein
MSDIAESDARGRGARRPQDIPMPGWRDIGLRVKDEMTADHVSIVAAGVAFYGLLAVFPAIAALISIAALIYDPAEIEAQLEAFAAALPQQAAEILLGQARKVAGGAGGGVGLAAVGGILLALYSASKGMKTLMEGMTIAYDETDTRGFIAKNVTALALTAMLVFGVLAAVALTIVLPALAGMLGLGETLRGWLTLAAWPVLGLLTIFGLAVVYRYAPSRECPRWRWVTPGALLATVLWVLGTLAFSVYVRNFGSYNETYGAIGGVIVLLLWMWLSAFIILMGAELNSEMEHQTRRDTTSGEPLPMGERGAVKADTVGRRP